MSRRRMELEEIKELLGRLPVGRLGLCREDRPYVVPVHYLYQQDKLYFHGSKNGLKMDYLGANPRVCFEVDELISMTKAATACDFSTEYRSVIAYGEARLIEDTEEKRAIANKLTEKYAGGASFEPAARERVEGTAIVEIAITDMTGRVNLRKP